MFTGWVGHAFMIWAWGLIPTLTIELFLEGIRSRDAERSLANEHQFLCGVFAILWPGVWVFRILGNGVPFLLKIPISAGAKFGDWAYGKRETLKRQY